MEEFANYVISVLALIVSVASAYYSWKQQKVALQRQIDDEIIDAIRSCSRYRTSLMALKREWEKTGSLADHDQREALDQFESVDKSLEPLIDGLRARLTDKRTKFDDLSLTELKSMAQMVESLTIKVEMFFERFRRFNENNLPEMKNKVEAIRKTLSSLQRG